MKRIFHLILCIAIILGESSCSFFDDNKSQRGSHETAAIEGHPIEKKGKIVEQDSLKRDLVKKIDTLTSSLNKIEKDNLELHETISNFGKAPGWWSYILLIVVVLFIFTIVIRLLSKEIQEQVGKQIKDTCINIGTLNTQEDVRQLEVKLKRQAEDIQHMNNRLDQFNKTIHDFLAQNQDNTQKNIPPSRTTNDSEYHRTGYANINSGTIFTKIFDSAQESCVFSIKFKSATKGEFNIISLDKIKSRNMWQEIVEYTGSIEDATSFKVEDFGICEKYDDVTWQVTKKLKIKLQK